MIWKSVEEKKLKMHLHNSKNIFTSFPSQRDRLKKLGRYKPTASVKYCIEWINLQKWEEIAVCETPLVEYFTDMVIAIILVVCDICSDVMIIDSILDSPIRMTKHIVIDIMRGTITNMFMNVFISLQILA